MPPLVSCPPPSRGVQRRQGKPRPRPAIRRLSLHVETVADGDRLGDRAAPATRQPPASLDEVIAALDHEQLAEVVRSAADRHEDVERMVRLVAARADGDLSAVREAIDRGLRTRRFLDYRESLAWAQNARPVVAELSELAATSPSRELVELLERAVGHVVKVILHADDSAGSIGDLAYELLDTHARACDAGVADQVRLARWMIRFRFKDQDFFDPDPVRYADALGDRGLAAYRKAIDDADTGDSFAVRHARQRLAVLDRDIDAIVKTTGGSLTTAGQFLHVAGAMAEIDRPDLVLQWAERGIAETNGYPIGALYDLACETYAQLGRPLDVLRLRRAHHERSPTTSTYAALKTAALALDTWEREADAARAVLRDRDTRSYIAALLADGDDDLAWQTAQSTSQEDLGTDLRITLAQRRQSVDPAEALGAFLAVADEILLTTDRRAYAHAIRVLKQARTAAQAAARMQVFATHITGLRDRHRRRPTLIAMLDKARLDGS